MTELSEMERDMLAFEHRWWKHVGAKEQAITDTFGISATLYYQRLRALIRRPEAQQHDPAVVNRLLRLEAQRERARRAG